MKGLLAAGAFAIAAMAPAAVTAACFTQREWSAMEVALLDREMEVAALSCRTVAGVDFIQELNQLRARHRIREFTAVLQGYYNRSFGAQGRTRFDRFMTVSSNDFSMRSFASANFCGDMLTLYKTVGSAEPGTVTQIATDRARELRTMSGEVCSTPAPRAPTTARTP